MTPLDFRKLVSENLESEIAPYRRLIFQELARPEVELPLLLTVSDKACYFMS